MANNTPNTPEAVAMAGLYETLKQSGSWAGKCYRIVAPKNPKPPYLIIRKLSGGETHLSLIDGGEFNFVIDCYDYGYDKAQFLNSEVRDILSAIGSDINIGITHLSWEITWLRRDDPYDMVEDLTGEKDLHRHGAEYTVRVDRKQEG